MQIIKSRWVTYYRVSTIRQGQSGLGLQAQQTAVTAYLTALDGQVIGEFTETESGKKASNRPQLQAALTLCRKKRATLVIAKLDRLARNVHFISGLLESGVNFVAVDRPTKDRFMLHVEAAFAEEESRRISQRTKDALAAAKLRGVVLGTTGRVRAKRYKEQAINLAKLMLPTIQQLRDGGCVTIRQMRDELNFRGIPSPAGARWHLPSVSRLLFRIRQ